MNNTLKIIDLHSKETKVHIAWFINASELAPGATAIIGDNPVAFFVIHHLALWVITASVLCSVVVIVKIHAEWRRFHSKLDFPVRFPLYLAIADTLWGISHFMDHMYLVTVQRFPADYNVKMVLCINLWLFLGYQQLMHASVAGYTYLRVVHQRTLNLGKWEWKLHSLWFTFLVAATVLFRFMDAFGNTGYWMFWDASTLNGQLLGLAAALTCTLNAFCTTFGYRSIRQTVINIKSKLRDHSVAVSNVNAEAKKDTSSQCLTTFVYVASFMYCPLALLVWINVLLQMFLGVVDPLSCLFIVVVSNCSGSVNAYGYFYNERLKKRKQRKEQEAKYPNSPYHSASNRSWPSHTSSIEV